MIEGVLLWQAIIFVSIAISGRKRSWVVAFWVVWTILQVFALWLSFVQFGTIWLAWSIFGNKSRTPDLPVGPVSRPAVAPVLLAEQARQDSAFEVELGQWTDQVLAFISRGRWIPKGTASRFLMEHPAPRHPRKTWKQAVGQSSPEETLRIQFDTLNAAHLAQQTALRDEFFRTVEKNPLTKEQIHACVCMDDAIMIVAAAGSGKTSTMVAKAGYALHEGLATPDQILLLAFNKATAEEVGQRIAEQLKGVPHVEKVRSNTFHAFGIDVIAKATGKKPSLAPWVDPSNPGGDVREVGDIIRTLSEQDATFKHDWDLFRTVYARDVGKWSEPEAPDAYGNGVRGFRTAQGEVVKSKEERTIADWLFYNGVNYVYEKPYEHDTASVDHRQYVPDFYYPECKLYHEHFALNQKGQAPQHFGDYVAGVKWKRSLHKANGTALFETTSHGLLTGEAIPALERALIRHGIQPVFDPDRKAPGLAPVHEHDLARSFRVFQQHVKNNGLTHQRLIDALAAQSKDGFRARLRMFLSIYERVAAEWEKRLRRGGFIDFEDMLALAAGHVESGAYKSPYTLILVDEFQDSTCARIRLLKALWGQVSPSAHLCVVGDDWQGINRFAGSDITVMTDFEKKFEHSTRLSLTTTFRCPQDLCEVSSQFVQANPAQIKKKVNTTNPLTKTPMLAYGFADQANIAPYIEKQLAHMYQLLAEGKLTPATGTRVTVMILGRYRDHEPTALKAWQHQYSDRLAIEYRTAHGSKGLEAEYVFVLNVVQGPRGFPSQVQDDPALQLAMPVPDPYPFAEERRLFYVAMTRARKQVRFYTVLGQPSQFLVELCNKHGLEVQPIDGDPLEPCPKCRAGVVTKRDGRYGAFLSCSRYPACDYKRNSADGASRRTQPATSQRITTPVSVGDRCPVCKQGRLQHRNGSSGPFLGCSRFRDGCRATANLKVRN